ncbi:MAG: class I SAM-dependent methyltransferase [Pseudomonadota bacterium]
MPDLLRAKDNWIKRSLALGFHLFDLVAYDVLYRFSPVRQQVFFNGGYLPIDEDMALPERLENEAPNAMMYHLVCKPLLQSGNDFQNILDVGCGQGGGLFYISRLFKDAKLVGTERNGYAVVLARRLCSTLPNVSAQKATNTRLDFADNRFDAVLSVGAPTYFGLSQFVSEAARVVQPGGIICFSGGYRQGNHNEIKAELRAACGENLELVTYRDITPNTFAALKADIPRREKLLKRVPWPFRLYGQKWADMPGSAEYDEYAKGLRADFMAVIKKRG